jgi:hypothetical protein
LKTTKSAAQQRPKRKPSSGDNVLCSVNLVTRCLCFSLICTVLRSLRYNVADRHCDETNIHREIIGSTSIPVSRKCRSTVSAKRRQQNLGKLLAFSPVSRSSSAGILAIPEISRKVKNRISLLMSTQEKISATPNQMSIPFATLLAIYCAM